MQTTWLNTQTKGKGIKKVTLIERLERDRTREDVVYHTPIASFNHATGKIEELNDMSADERKYVNNTFQGLKLQIA